MAVKKLSALTVCVGRADALRLTLPWNLRQVDELIVVTTEDDVGTQRVLGHNTNATTVISNRCYEDGDTFNLGKMQNEGLKRLAPDADWVLFFCCDVLLNKRLGEFFHGQTLDPQALYGTLQYDAEAWKAVSFAEHIPETTNIPDGVRAEPNGYFQLWNRHVGFLPHSWPAVMSEAFCSAGGPDSWFCQQWPADKLIMVPQLAVVHILHQNRQIGAGWNNGPAKRPSWRQCGFIGRYGQYGMIEEVPPGPQRFRLTETKTGEQVEVTLVDGADLPPEIVCGNGRGGLLFKGRDIDFYHVHVARWCE